MTATLRLGGVTIADLSRWNPETEPNFEAAIKGGLAGVIVKYSQGLTSADPERIDHSWNAHAAGVGLLGAYHFGDDSDPVAQANHFLSLVRDDYGGDLTGRLLMLDLEGDGASTMPVASAATFVATIKTQVGRWPILYMGRSGPDGKGTGLPNEILSNCDLMLPAYGSHPDLGPILPPGFRVPANDADSRGCVRLHQFSDGAVNGGPFPGLGKIDQSQAVGFSSIAALTAWWGR